jgi:HSP20 family protein
MTLEKLFNPENRFPDEMVRFSPVSDLFDEFFRNSGFMGTRQAVPPANIYEMPDQWRIEISAPGYEKSDFSVNLDKHVLTVGLEKKSEKSEKDVKYSRREFDYSAWNRRFDLPDAADSDKIKTEYKNGILVLSVPKREEALEKPARQIAVH